MDRIEGTWVPLQPKGTKTMKKSVLMATVLALLPASAFAQITLQDTGFVAGATHVDLVSIQEGQTAVSDASDPAVKNYAHGMIETHTDANHVLASIVPPLVLPLTTTKSPCMTWQAVLIQNKAWTPFDAAYIQASVYNLRRQVSVLQGEMQAGSDPNLKDYAQKRLPGVQAQLDAALALQSGHPAALPPPVTVRPTFRSGQWDLSPTDQQGLNYFAHRLAGMQQVAISAIGYTDNVRIGPDLAKTGVTTNEILSEKRAESVQAYLVSQGVVAGEIQTQGRGEADPVASNATDAGRAQNRRVVVSVNATGAAPMANGLGPATGVLACAD
jgi:outer membrane protein OmpA-like peptidoglycan-associated protein